MSTDGNVAAINEYLNRQEDLDQDERNLDLAVEEIIEDDEKMTELGDNGDLEEDVVPFLILLLQADNKGDQDDINACVSEYCEKVHKAIRENHAYKYLVAQSEL